MRRWRLSLIALLCPLLVAATLPEVDISPAVQRLGEPLQLNIRLPDADWQLSGYPDLRPFRLLGAPEKDAGVLRLTLLPLRPGPAKIPVFPLHKGSRTWDSPSRTIQIEDPYQDMQTASAPRAWPEGEGPSPFWWWLAPLAIGLPGFLGWRRARGRIVPPTAAHPLQELLAQLDRLPDSPAKNRLREELDGFRFGPYHPAEKDLSSWQERLHMLEEQQ